MEQFFGISVAQIGVALGVTLAVLIGVLVFWGARGRPCSGAAG